MKGYIIIEVDAPGAGPFVEWQWKRILNKALSCCGSQTKMRVVRAVTVEERHTITTEINGDWVSGAESNKDEWSSP